MDSISEEYAVDQAAIGSARSEPVINVRGLFLCPECGAAVQADGPAAA